MACFISRFIHSQPQVMHSINYLISPLECSYRHLKSKCKVKLTFIKICFLGWSWNHIFMIGRDGRVEHSSLGYIARLSQNNNKQKSKPAPLKFLPSHLMTASLVSVLITVTKCLSEAMEAVLVTSEATVSLLERGSFLGCLNRRVSNSSICLPLRPA